MLLPNGDQAHFFRAPEKSLQARFELSIEIKLLYPPRSFYSLLFLIELFFYIFPILGIYVRKKNLRKWNAKGEKT